MRTLLSDIFDLDAFYEQIENGDIVVRDNASNPDYRIANYGPDVQFSRKWTPETLASRGLIYNERTKEIISRGFPKFFNWDDASQPFPRSGSVIKSDKFDGSLGILYAGPDGELAIATRGSFISEQAVHATKVFHDLTDQTPELYHQAYELIAQNLTPVFEIIYPENRIVVDYGSADSLVLLDVIDNATGMSQIMDFTSFDWPEKAEKTILTGGFYDTIASSVPDDEEGYVLYWPHTGFRCKVKGANYIRLHSVLTETSSRDLWRHMAVHANKDRISKPNMWANALGIDPKVATGILAKHEDWLSDMIKDVPDEFYGWIRRTMETIEYVVDKYVTYGRKAAREILQEAGDDTQYRWHLSKHYENGGVFLKYANTGNDNDLVWAAWKYAFPAFEKPFANVRVDDED